MFINPTVSQFKTYFFRDFPYGTNPDENILDADLEKAFLQASVNINRALFSNETEYQMAFMYLWAHYLCIDMQMSSQGISGQYNFSESSKSVGSVSQSFVVPQRFQDNPYLLMLSKTPYGAKYLEMILPMLSGGTDIAYGRTLP